MGLLLTAFELCSNFHCWSVGILQHVVCLSCIVTFEVQFQWHLVSELHSANGSIGRISKAYSLLGSEMSCANVNYCTVCNAVL